MKQEKSCGCIIINEEKILLIQQKQGFWGFPKGHIETNETEQETAIREVKEETNIDVKIEKDYRYKEEYITDKGTQKEVVYFIAQKIGGSLKVQEEEVKTAKGVGYEEALETLTYDDTRSILKQALTDKKLI